MYKISITLVFLLLLVSSCDFFYKEQKPIDFTKLDRYPVFYGCDSTASPEILKMCFEQSVAEYIQKDLDTCSYMRNENG